jgi:hypothetical protein
MLVCYSPQHVLGREDTYIRSMKSFIVILFYKFFQFSKYIGNADDDSYSVKSVAILSLFLSLNFFTAVAYFNCLIQHLEPLQLSIIVQVLSVVLIRIIIYL